MFLEVIFYIYKDNVYKYFELGIVYFVDEIF